MVKEASGCFPQIHLWLHVSFWQKGNQDPGPASQCSAWRNKWNHQQSQSHGKDFPTPQSPTFLWLVLEFLYLEQEQHIKKQRHYFANKGPSGQSYGFSSSHVRMWELDHKEGWVPKNWCFWTVVLEKTLESPLDYKEIKAVNSKGNQSWIFTGKTDAEVEAPILWPPDAKSQFTGKDPDAGNYWGQEEKGTTEDEMVGWYHWLNGYEFEQTLGDSERQGSLVCCRPWCHKEMDMTEQLNKSRKESCLRYWSEMYYSKKKIII